MHDGAGTTASDKHTGHDSTEWKRRRWSALEIGIVVGSFIVFWPVGVALLIVKLTQGELWRGTSDMVPPWQNWSSFEHDLRQAWARRKGTPASSGNVAFDAYRQTQLERLEAERRKLDEERDAFAAYLAKLRRAKDQEEFDHFMAERKAAMAAD